MHLGAVAALRGRQWLHFLPLPLVATTPAWWSSSGPGAGTGALECELARMALAVMAAAGALGWAYGLNAIADRATDDANGKNPFAGRERVGGAAAATVAMAGALGLIAGAVLGATGAICALTSLAAGALYSLGPRAKAVPLVGLVVNVLIFVPLVGLAWTPGRTPPAMPSLVATFVALLAQNQLVHERADRMEDARAQALTTARLLGPTGTRLALGIVTVAGTAMASALGAGVRSGAMSGAVLAVGAIVGAMEAGGAARARRWHRVVSVIGGAALWAWGG